VVVKKEYTFSALDYASWGLLIFFVALFSRGSNSASGFAAASVVVGCCCALWLSLKKMLQFPWFARVVVTVFVVVGNWLWQFVGREHLMHLSIFIFLFNFFSISETRPGAVLRILCGLIAGVLVFSELPALFGLAAAVLVLLVSVGGLISLWSSMTLHQALIWFAKRSIRKETVFLILFLAGIAAIGLRQAQNYANAQAGLSGLSSALKPGSLNHLQLSPALALRLKFVKSPGFDLNSAYIRGTVMDRVTGFTWSQGPSRIRGRLDHATNDIKYRISVSPRYADFIPVLDFGLSVESANKETPINYGRDNGVFVPQEYSTLWREFNVLSSLMPLHNLKSEDRKLLLQVAGDLDPKVVKLAKQLGGEAPDVKKFTSMLAHYFATDGFRYTLEPGGDSTTLEGFLFQGKSGYCEHYSSATATLARISGIPARVVAGFLGGAWEQSSLTLFVRDLDAHAWVELWDDQAQAWTRFDPVESIAPERVSMGSEYYLRSIGASIPDELSLREKLWMTSFFIELDNFLAGLSSDVTGSAAQSIIDHGEELALLGAFGLTISYVFLLMRRHRLQVSRPEIKVVSELESYLRRRNFDRSAGEPLYSWLQRIAYQAGVVDQELLSFAEVHARFCYGKRANLEDLKRMTSLLGQIKRKI